MTLTTNVFLLMKLIISFHNNPEAAISSREQKDNTANAFQAIPNINSTELPSTSNYNMNLETIGNNTQTSNNNQLEDNSIIVAGIPIILPKNIIDQIFNKSGVQEFNTFKTLDLNDGANDAQEMSSSLRIQQPVNMNCERHARIIGEIMKHTVASNSNQPAGVFTINNIPFGKTIDEHVKFYDNVTSQMTTSNLSIFNEICRLKNIALSTTHNQQLPSSSNTSADAYDLKCVIQLLQNHILESMQFYFQLLSAGEISLPVTQEMANALKTNTSKLVNNDIPSSSKKLVNKGKGKKFSLYNYRVLNIMKHLYDMFGVGEIFKIDYVKYYVRSLRFISSSADIDNIITTIAKYECIEYNKKTQTFKFCEEFRVEYILPKLKNNTIESFITKLLSWRSKGQEFTILDMKMEWYNNIPFLDDDYFLEKIIKLQVMGYIKEVPEKSNFKYKTYQVIKD